MVARLRLITNQDLDRAPSSHRRDPPTQRGLPRVLQPGPAELRAGVNDRSRYAAPAPRATLALSESTLPFAETEVTIEYDAGAPSRLPPPGALSREPPGALSRQPPGAPSRQAPAPSRPVVQRHTSPIGGRPNADPRAPVLAPISTRPPVAEPARRPASAPPLRRAPTSEVPRALAVVDLPAGPVDLDLGRARHADPFASSTLIALSDLHARRWPMWVALGVGASAVAGLTFWFFG